MNKEEILFQMYKDTVATGDEKSRYLLQQKFPDVNISNLHIKIANYQVEKYGYSLNSQARTRQIRMAKAIEKRKG